MKWRNTVTLIIIVFLGISGCAPSEDSIQAAIVQTQSAWTPVPTNTPYATYTPYPTPTPYPTYTPRPTYTPFPTPTSTSTPTPTTTPTFSETAKIGPIYDSLYESSYSIDISVLDVRWLKTDGYSTPKAGNEFVIVYVKVVNQGPGSVRSFGSGDFQVLDANGILRSYDFINSTSDCRIEIFDLMPNATLTGCIAFEVPDSGKVEFIYAPYRYEGLKPGRYLSFIIRP